MNRLPTPVALSRQPGINRDLVRLIRLQALSTLSGTEDVEQQTERLRRSIPVVLWRSFDHVAGHGRRAVDLITESGACGSCHLKLPSGVVSCMHWRDLGQQIYQCPHCGCFLYPSAMLPLLESLLKSPRPERSRSRHSVLGIRGGRG